MPLKDQLIRTVRIDWSQVPQDSYLRGILALVRLEELELAGNITVFAGENGTGKSTLLEAIAVAAGFGREGGTFGFQFSTYDDVSPLHEALTLVRGFARPQAGAFLRAESFFNVATAALTEYDFDDTRDRPDWHKRSHGESFLSFLGRMRGRCLFLLDEPEAALSPARQLDLAAQIVERAGEGSQFIIATHSSIMLGISGAQVLSFDEGHVHEVPWSETGAVRTMRDFLNERLG